MEEEAQRLAQGQVPDPVPAVVLSKDSTPSSINAIFSPPINQFEYNSPTIPTYNPFETESPLGEAYKEYNMETEAAAAPTSLEFKHGEEPMEGSEAPQVGAHDSDSDEAAAAGAQGVAQPFNLHDAPTPTAEEVDAALAELDSIPDGVCESGDVEEEEEEEEEWSYYRMEPQTQPQSEDVLVPGSAAAALQPSETIPQAADKVDDQDSLNVAELNEDQPEGYLELTKGEFEDNPEPQELIRHTQSQELIQGFQEQSVDQVVFQEPSTDELVFQDQLGKQLDLQGEEFATLKERPQESLDLFVDLEKAQSKLMDGLQFQPKEQSSPTEANRTPVMESSPDFFQTSIEKPLDLEITSDGVSLMETSMVKTPDGIGSSIEPTSPHGSISPHIPGSPRSVEGFITSVELNAPEESFGTNFAINQSQDLFVGAVDQPSGPFSVYVSSSPEPASLDPSLQTTMDIVNVSEGVTNGLVDDDIKVSQPEDFSPVEIVHAQSTVEVVAPPSPVDIREPEMQFTIPEQMQELSAPAQIPADLSPSSDITFIPEPVVEPVAEVPVPVYIEGNTPVSEGEMEDLDISTEEIKTEEIISAKDQIPEVEKHDLAEDTKIEVMVCTKDQIPEVEKHDLAEDTKLEEMVCTRDQIPEVETATISNSDTVPTTKDETPELLEVVKAPIESEMDVEIKSETVVIDKNETITKIDSEIINAATVNGILEESSAITDVVSSAVNETVPVDVTHADGEKESEMLKVDAAVAKSDKTPGKSTPVKSPFKSGKATPGRAVPSKSTPTRSPSARITEKKAPVTRTTAVPGKPAVEKSSTTKPAPTKPAATKPAATKPTLTKPTNTRLTTRPTPRTATARPPTTTPPPPKAIEKRITKPSTPTAPRAASSKPSATAAATAASKAAPARPTPAARTMTKRPVTAPSKTTEKPDDGTVRKAAPRPTTAPRTTTAATTNTTTTTTARKAATASTKSAAEKETKNTTNRILSTSRPAPKPLAGTTKPTLSKTSTARTTSVTNAKATSKVNGTSTTTTSTSKPKTTSTTRSATAKSTGVTARRTVVSKTKTSATGGKVESVKAGKAEVIETIQPVVNGENKIADEETSVEVIEKCVVEDIMQASTEKVFTESSHIMTTSEQVVTTETTEVIVNGDH